MAFDIIVLLVVVFLIFQKLWGVLGTRPEKISRPISKESAAKIFDILMKETMKQSDKDDVLNGGELDSKPKEMTETEKVLAKIPNFDANRFLLSAQKAFEMIVVSFAKGEIEILKPLLNSKMFKNFEKIIKQRKEDNITAETDFVGFNSVEIVNADIDEKKNAKISVRFVSEQANVLRSGNGEIIEGDENFIQSVTDVWTFERNIESKSPNWLLVSTKK